MRAAGGDSEPANETRVESAKELLHTGKRCGHDAEMGCYQGDDHKINAKVRVEGLVVRLVRMESMYAESGWYDGARSISGLITVAGKDCLPESYRERANYHHFRPHRHDQRPY